MVRTALASGALGLVLVAGACGGGETPRRKPAAASAGAVLYETWSCAICHGPDRRGTPNGPSLLGVSKYWTADDLADYLRDPQAKVVPGSRLGEYTKTYPDLRMPDYSHEPESDRRMLADWLLSAE